MNEQQIKQTWKRLYIPFSIGLIILIGGILWHLFGSKRPDPQVYSFFLSLFGAVLSFSAAVKMYKFKQYLKRNSL